MGKVKRMKNGQFQVRTEAEAIEALTRMEEFQAEVAELQREHGILELMEDATELKKAATAWAEKNLEGEDNRVDLGNGRWGTLIRGAEQVWVLTKTEAPKMAGVVPLRQVLKKKFKSPEEFKEIWKRATKTVANPEGIDALVSEGILTDDEIAPALIEKKRAPYLRMFGASE
jgi:hypothetical protein